jgi:hypothetical protein
MHKCLQLLETSGLVPDAGHVERGGRNATRHGLSVLHVASLVWNVKATVCALNGASLAQSHR